MNRRALLLCALASALAGCGWVALVMEPSDIVRMVCRNLALAGISAAVLALAAHGAARLARSDSLAGIGDGTVLASASISVAALGWSLGFDPSWQALASLALAALLLAAGIAEPSARARRDARRSRSPGRHALVPESVPAEAKDAGVLQDGPDGKVGGGIEGEGEG